MFDSTAIENLAEHGYCILPGVLSPDEATHARKRLVNAATESERRGISTYIESLDPNANNVRVFNLLDLDPVFLELIAHPVALKVVRHLLTDDFIISNFTANIAKPGSGSMIYHSDLAVVLPEPWLASWSINIIWCLDDVYGENGATRFLPGSHRYERTTDLPENMGELMVPFEAERGSIVAMDGRLWHTSGENKTKNAERALLFGYYSRSFIRPQWNFNVGLSAETQSTLSAEMRRWLGLELTANISPIKGLN